MRICLADLFFVLGLACQVPKEDTCLYVYTLVENSLVSPQTEVGPGIG